MLRDRLLLGVPIGLVAAAATAGALVGFGSVRGAPFQPLNSIAHVVVGSRAFYVVDANPLVTSAGIIVHVVSLVAWGMLFALALRHMRGVKAWAIAFLFALAAALVDFVLLPERFSPGFETMLTRGEVIVIYGVMAAAMAGAARWLTRLRTEDRGSGD